MIAPCFGHATAGRFSHSIGVEPLEEPMDGKTPAERRRGSGNAEALPRKLPRVFAGKEPRFDRLCALCRLAKARHSTQTLGRLV